ncbi:bifunctional heptose 7-phosphate kinase/heptose 1-phosphate adenyltransferase [Sphingomonas melonis TY]|uniref:Bifunctional protein HldE n=1 Tax=Sphingomonas melonis TY TaxID=621456 RepID=A0A175XZE2_9SPHN|nr:D-glycero-beta-D-manno-heptose-7-phosphate kinase [Sphingomonas melonis]AOW24557.1 bifunctional heptose 7-phosphate kinase/heptose 1-phosphate adenyltransferase [Sphingomonas melonis TY]KZB93595.1 bifunctional heptose 7-phosphate kinase/heptose 1-phosphate adenyltransferase [Sphingomonas melonis TY]
MTRLPDFASVRVLCVGDIMVDGFAHGDVQRISPESPVPVIHIRRTERVPGGAANVARNISALKGQCTLIGVIGDDVPGRELSAMLRAHEGIEPILVVDSSRPTVEKVRFVANGQHLLRADWEEAGAIGTAAHDAIATQVAALARDHNVLVLSDYAKGVLTDRLVAELIRVANSAGLQIVVDPKSADLARYAGADVVTPNSREITLATGINPSCDENAERAGARAVTEARVDAVLITRAEQGMSLISHTGNVAHLPASVREVADVVGAGDTVVGTLALCLGAALPLAEAARIANAAAGVVVGKPGTATLSRSELAAELARLDRLDMPRSVTKLISAGEAARLCREWREDGLSIGFTNGCFDLMHIGHVGILEFARAHCDRLIVGVNADSSVTRLKGSSRPINREEDRARILGALGCVEAVVIFAEDTPFNLIDQLQPDVLIKGGDYAVEDVVGFDLVQARGGRTITFDLIPGRSTTLMIDRAASSAAPDAV